MLSSSCVLKQLAATDFHHYLPSLPQSVKMSDAAQLAAPDVLDDRESQLAAREAAVAKREAAADAREPLIVSARQD